jgi:hypothetical protein
LFRALLHFLVLIAAATPALAQVYKWVDEKGVTHYGERPPQGRKASEVPHKLGSPGGRSSAPPDAARQSSAPQADATAEQRQETARREEQCRQQRELLARLKQSPQTTAEHYGAIARQQKMVAEQCKG